MEESKPAQAKKTGGQLFFEAARQYGISHVFGNPGTTEANFMDALFLSPDIKFFLCLQEGVATGAADGFYRVSGRPAMVNLHLLPGLGNGLSNLHNAKRARVPVIVTVGDHHTRFGLEESPISGDIAGAARSLCKWTGQVTTAEDLPALLHRAMQQALTPPRGPVCLILPNNLFSQVVNEEVKIPALNIARSGPAHPEAINEAVALLSQAKKPLVVVGDVMTFQGQEALLNIARLCGAAIWREPFPTSFEPANDPLAAASANRLPYFPKLRRQILQNSDLLLLAGVSGFTSHFLYDDDPVLELVPPNIPVIHLEADLEELGKNAKSAFPLAGDVDLTLVQLLEQLEKRPGKKVEAAQPEPAPDQNVFKADDNSPLTAVVLGKALRAGMPRGTIYIDEAITAGTGMNPVILNGNRDLSKVLTVRGGSLGYGIPASIGAQLAAPGTPVLAVIGDGTALYTIQSLWTLARYKLPVVTVICNNGNYDIITLEILRAKGALAAEGIERIQEYTAMKSPGINFAALAAGFGVKGYRISKPSQILPALQEAFASGEPALLDVELASSLRNV